MPILPEQSRTRTRCSADECDDEASGDRECAVSYRYAGIGWFLARWRLMTLSIHPATRVQDVGLWVANPRFGVMTPYGAALPTPFYSVGMCPGVGGTATIGGRVSRTCY